MVADVVDRVRAGAAAGLRLAVVGLWPVEAGNNAAHDIVDIGEVAPHVAVVEQGQRLARVEGLGEDPHRHVRPAPWPIDGEEAQAGQRQPVEVA